MVFNATFNNISAVALNTIKQTNVEIDRHVIAEILLKVALNTIKQTNVEIDRLFLRLFV
jgi:ribosomal protein L20